MEPERDDKKNDIVSRIVVDLVEAKKPKIQSKLRSFNRFAILDSIVEETKSLSSDLVEQGEEKMVVCPRKARAASSGVADLMKFLKP